MRSDVFSQKLSSHFPHIFRKRVRGGSEADSGDQGTNEERSIAEAITLKQVERKAARKMN
jgi:hypothetical protein